MGIGIFHKIVTLDSRKEFNGKNQMKPQFSNKGAKLLQK
jgi:hypothetical protein